MTTLRLAPLPAAPAAAAARTAATRAGLVRALRARRVRGVVTDPAAPLPGALAADLRRAGMVVACRITAGRALPAGLAQRAAEGPLLVVVEPGAGPDALASTLEVLVALRLPTLRIALFAVPTCHRGGWAGDLAVVVHGAPAPPGPAERCAGCARSAGCLGPPAGAAVAPLPAAESNQFDLVVRAERPLPPGPPASWPAEVPAADLPRHLWLLRSDRLLTCVCDNTGWTSERLGALLDGLGQAWLDRSDKARLDDFAADMAPLKQVAPARVDPGGLGRPAVWEVADGDPFAAEERALEAVLAPLRGSVIDIGAGPIRYLSLLAERIATGAVRYVAVEPDRAALVRTRDALPGAGLTRGEGEHLPIRSGVADHVLMLRSFNHLHDVPQAFSEASRVAAPGATLVVVDNVAFGLVRTPEQVAAARAIPVTETPFEHFRNANADAAVAAILATGAWRIDEVRAVAAGRANQWLVVARRLG